MSKKEKKLAIFLEKLADFILSFHFYFYFLIAVAVLCTYYWGFPKVFNGLVIVMLTVYILELIIGYDRNFLGLFGMILFGIIGYLITKTTSGALLGITYAILIINIMKIVLSYVISEIASKAKR